MADASLNHRSAAELVRLIATKAASPVEVLDAHLAAIERLNPKVNAVVTLVAEQAMAAARRAEHAVMAGEPLGLLHGLPIGIKDVTPTAGIRTTYGSPLHADHVPAEDAAIVARLKQAGSVIVGKTNTPEFAAGANTVNPVFGATRNPWNLKLSAGGSTGGGAAAVACGMIALAEGTDFGGSLRVPAAFCGVVGIRPTPGIVPRVPVPLPWDFTSVEGPIARTAEDAALMLDAVVGLTNLSPISMLPPWQNLAASVASTRDAKGLRIAYALDIAGVGVDAAIESLCRKAALRLADAGATIEEIPFSLADGRDAFIALRGEIMVARFLEDADATHKYGANLKGNIDAGLRLTIRDVTAAERKRAELWNRCRALFERVDLLLTPTAPVPPFPVEQNYPDTIAGKKMATYIDWIAPTFVLTLCSLPAASVPCGLGADGLPVGLQIAGPRFAEPRVLGLAKIVQEMNPIGWAPMVGAAA